MSTIDVGDAQARWPEILSALTPGEQVVIVESGEPIATMTRTAPRRWPCQAGSAKHTKHWMAPDFDAPLDDFQEYMQ